MFCKKDVFRNFTKFTGKHLYQNLFFNKLAGPRKVLPTNIFKRAQIHYEKRNKMIGYIDEEIKLSSDKDMYNNESS